jgi:hypothetical protein
MKIIKLKINENQNLPNQELPLLHSVHFGIPSITVISTFDE